ncbi:MAG: hypothetical protein Q8P02_03160 [Candidatus Micrarchaeota archaeon]|nr:hypothetical protein [Candidatus Micrarchaeota archaeon]
MLKFKPMRGQAFETMMLVISVIVAIAILGVLLNILGGVSFGVNDPTEVMKTELKNIVSSGFGVSQPKEAEFKTGSIILRKAVIADSPVVENELEFQCSDSNLCGGTSAPLDVQRDSVTINRNSKGWIVVCGDDTSTRDPKYCIGIGRQQTGARTDCLQACNIQ